MKKINLPIAILVSVFLSMVSHTVAALNGSVVQFINVERSTYLGLSGSTVVHKSDGSGTDTQWRLISVGSDYYLQNEQTSSFLTYLNSSTIRVTSFQGGESQWSLVSVNADVYLIQNVISGRNIDSDRNGRVDSSVNSNADKQWTMVIQGPPAPPIANDDIQSVQQNSNSNIFAVLSNDDVNDASISAITQGDQGGSVSISGSTLVYTPATDFLGTETFSYSLANSGGSDTAIVTVTVNEVVVPVAGSPIATNDSTGVRINSSNNYIAVFTNDILNGATITAATNGSQGGSVSISGNTLVYTPPSNFSGTDTFTYTLSNGAGEDTASVTIAVNSSSGNLSLFENLYNNVLEREAFSDIKDQNWGTTFEAQVNKLGIRNRFVNANTDAELYSAVNLLSNARRDRHLAVRGPGNFDFSAAPIRFLPDFSDPDMFDLNKAKMFVSQVGNHNSVSSVSPGDELIRVNGRLLAEHLELIVPEYRMSTLAHGLVRQVGDGLAEYDERRSPYLYRDDGFVLYNLRRNDGTEYEVLVPYAYNNLDNVPWQNPNPLIQPDYEGYQRVVSNIDLEFWVPESSSSNTVIIRWKDLEEVENSLNQMMSYAASNGYLSYNVLLDATISSGGSGSPLVIQRLASSPFLTTFGNVRCSDISDNLAANLGGNKEDWINNGCQGNAEYTSNEPFKLRYFNEGEDGIMQPNSTRFTGTIAGIFFPYGGSNLDQLSAMFIDNNIGESFGLPTGGYSNTWEWDTTVSGFEFSYNVGHTIRPNGQVLEGNPALPNVRIPMTKDNFSTYMQDLVDTALGHLENN